MDDDQLQQQLRDASPADSSLWPAHHVQLTRGRQPRDAQAKTVPYNVHSLAEFESSLRSYLDNPPEHPEHTDAQLSVWIGTSFMVLAATLAGAGTNNNNNNSNKSAVQRQQHVQTAPQSFHQPPNGLSQHYGAPYNAVADPSMALGLSNYPPTATTSAANAESNRPERVSLTVMDALQHTGDPKEKMRKQRAIARCCVDAIQRIDGYRYSFHNCWNSREDDSFRFSYYCNDSLLNKDRAANGKGAKLGKRATKRVYDCKGVISVKFSATKQTLDVFYKHVPIHKTYEERAPPPRKDSKRRKYMEEHDPEALVRSMQRQKSAKADEEEPVWPADSKPARPETPRPSNTSLESDLRAQSLRSLLELIQVDPPSFQRHPEPAPPPPPPPPPPRVVHQPLPTPGQIVPVFKRRSGNSCNVCRVKKTKCDGARPVCQTCIDKKRECFYTTRPEGDPLPGNLSTEIAPGMISGMMSAPMMPPQITPIAEPVRQAPPSSSVNELSELEKMKKELEDAKARIKELEQEKLASPTTIQTPPMPQLSRPQSQPQPPQPQSHHRHSLSQPLNQPQPQQPQRQQVPNAQQQHRQQLAQLNQQRSRSINSPKQMPFKVSTPPQQSRVLNAGQQQTPQQASQTQSANQQLQVGVPTLNTGTQIQNPQTYFNSAHTNHMSYASMNRSMTQGSMSSNPNMTNQQANPVLPQSVAINISVNQPKAQQPPSQQQQQQQQQQTPQLAQAQQQQQQRTQNAVPPNADNPYTRADFTWTPHAYYGYQNAAQPQVQVQQQQQQQPVPPSVRNAGQRASHQSQQEQWAAAAAAAAAARGGAF